MIGLEGFLGNVQLYIDTSPWLVFVGGNAVGKNRFGASAPGDALGEKFGFTVDNIVGCVKELL